MQLSLKKQDFLPLNVLKTEYSINDTREDSECAVGLSEKHKCGQLLIKPSRGLWIVEESFASYARPFVG